MRTAAGVGTAPVLGVPAESRDRPSAGADVACGAGEELSLPGPVTRCWGRTAARPPQPGRECAPRARRCSWAGVERGASSVAALSAIHPRARGRRGGPSPGPARGHPRAETVPRRRVLLTPIPVW
jgi:hypothetical protein